MEICGYGFSACYSNLRQCANKKDSFLSFLFRSILLKTALLLYVRVERIGFASHSATRLIRASHHLAVSHYYARHRSGVRFSSTPDTQVSGLLITRLTICASRENRTLAPSLARTCSTIKPYPRWSHCSNSAYFCK